MTEVPDKARASELLRRPPEGRPYVSEEDAKIRWIVPLLEALGHDRNEDMAFEVPVTWQAGTEEKQGFADIIVYVGDILVIVVETKAPGKSLQSARDQAITYAKSFSPIVPFVMAHDTSQAVLYRASAQQGKVGDYVAVDGFPSKAELLSLIGLGEEVPAAVAEKERAVGRVVASEHYRVVLEECLRTVLSRADLTGVTAVSELSKVLLAKSYHDQHETGRFRPGAGIKRLLDDAKTDYPGLYASKDSIALERETFDMLARLLNQVEV